jgi:hypothetical protein
MLGNAAEQQTSGMLGWEARRRASNAARSSPPCLVDATRLLLLFCFPCSLNRGQHSLYQQHRPYFNTPNTLTTLHHPSLPSSRSTRLTALPRPSPSASHFSDSPATPSLVLSITVLSRRPHRAFSSLPFPPPSRLCLAPFDRVNTSRHPQPCPWTV